MFPNITIGRTEELAEVAEVLRDFLLLPTEALNRDKLFEMAWQDSGPWRQ